MTGFFFNTQKEFYSIFGIGLKLEKTGNLGSDLNKIHTDIQTAHQYVWTPQFNSRNPLCFIILLVAIIISALAVPVSIRR